MAKKSRVKKTLRVSARKREVFKRRIARGIAMILTRDAAPFYTFVSRRNKEFDSKVALLDVSSPISCPLALLYGIDYEEARALLSLQDYRELRNDPAYYGFMLTDSEIDSSHKQVFYEELSQLWQLALVAIRQKSLLSWMEEVLGWDKRKRLVVL